MTNINIKTTTLDELTTRNLKDLQNLAKELKVKNWWTMKKADLLTNVADSIFDLQEKELEGKKEKKAPKAKKEKAPKVEKNEENLVTIKELAAEFHMKGTKARRLLRNETAARPFGGNRWEWDKDLHSKELETAREILKAYTK